MRGSLPPPRQTGHTPRNCVEIAKTPSGAGFKRMTPSPRAYDTEPQNRPQSRIETGFAVKNSHSLAMPTRSECTRHEQHIGRHAERSGNALDIVQKDIAHLMLDMGNEGAMQARLEGQRFLRPAQFAAQADHVGGQDRAC